MGLCLTFMAVDAMRRGAAPGDAAAEALQAVVEHHEMLEHYQLGLITLRPDGQWSHAALRKGYSTVVKSSAIDNAQRGPERVLLG